jgi:hypothetical protein
VKERVTMSEEEQKRDPSGNITLPVDWHVSENIQSRYATNMVSQPIQHEFVISFFEAQPPILVGTPEENKMRFQELGAIRAECVARIIVAAERLPEFIEVLQTTLATYRASKEAD